MFHGQPRWRHYLDRVYLGIIRGVIHRRITVDFFLGELVVRRAFLAFGLRASDRAGQTHKIGLFQRWPELLIRVVIETNECESPLWGFRRRPKSKSADKGATRQAGVWGIFSQVAATQANALAKQDANVAMALGRCRSYFKPAARAAVMRWAISRMRVFTVATSIVRNFRSSMMTRPWMIVVRTSLGPAA